METTILPTDTPELLKEAVTRSVGQLVQGEAVALPTETVYGLAADALNAEAVAKIFEIKERPSFDPLIVHLPHHNARQWLSQLTTIEEKFAKPIARLLENFCPGPLTFLLPKTERVPDIVTSGLPEVAIRISEHPTFQKIIKELDAPLAAPSANRFGKISPTSAEAVKAELDGKINLIVDGGACSHGLESTIIRLLKPERSSNKKAGKIRIEILRPGPITPDQLKKYGKIVFPEKNHNQKDIVQVPGQLSSHYAPRTPLYLVENANDFIPEKELRYGLLSYKGGGSESLVDLHDWEKVNVLSPNKGKLPEARAWLRVGNHGSPKTRLY